MTDAALKRCGFARAERVQTFPTMTLIHDRPGAEFAQRFARHDGVGHADERGTSRGPPSDSPIMRSKRATAQRVSHCPSGTA